MKTCKEMADLWNVADRKSLPIGISDYVRAQLEYYYVDKAMLIKDFQVSIR